MLHASDIFNYIMALTDISCYNTFLLKKLVLKVSYLSVVFKSVRSMKPSYTCIQECQVNETKLYMYTRVSGQ